MKKEKVFYITIIVIAILAAAASVYYYINGRQTLDFAKVLDKTAVTVDGNALTVEDTAFYVFYQEQTVEEQARIYNSEDTNDYWNLHINGEFVKVSARTAAMEMAVHDEIFYQMAIAEEVVLSEEEERIMKNSQSDFWMDLSDEAKERTGVSQEALDRTIEKMALAQKYQDIYAQMQDDSYEAYDFEGAAYEELRQEHDVTINDNIWNRLDFGNIILEH